MNVGGSLQGTACDQARCFKPYGAIHAELLTRYERAPLTASNGIKVSCRGLEPFKMRFRTCRVSKLLRYPGGEEVNQRSEKLHRIAWKISEGRLEFVKESAQNVTKVRCAGLPEFWVKDAPMCRIRNPKMRRIAGLGKVEPLRRIYGHLLDGTLEKVNSLLPSAMPVKCDGVLPFLVQPSAPVRRRVK